MSTKHATPVPFSSLNPFSYWVLKGKLAAGEYPGNQFSLNAATMVATLVHQAIALFSSGFSAWNTPSWKIGNLMDSGIDTFIDLTELGERPGYGSYLHKERRRRSRRSTYYRFPITDRDVPDKGAMKELLDLLDSEMDAGRSVYVHCFRGLGRTGTVVGCYLVSQGLSGSEALSRISELRKDVAGSFRKSPETDIQRDFVRNWS